MKSFIAFTKKEFIENIRTYRFLSLVSILALLGITSPLLTKITPDLLRNINTNATITLPDPTAIQSWAQFFSNSSFLGNLALIITFCGSMANELTRGTLINLLTKGMKRHTIILSKAFSASVLWTISYAIALIICYGYTEYLWPGSTLSNAPLAFLSLWLFGELLIMLLLFGGTLFGNFYGSLLSCLGIIIVFNLLNIIPEIKKYNPMSLASTGVSLLNGEMLAGDILPAISICVVAIILLPIISILIFNKKKV